MSNQVTKEQLQQWVNEPDGPVALYLRQRLLPVGAVDGEETGIVFPPTYAVIGYNIDTLSDGKKVATIDSVGSQANRLEPFFKAALGSPNTEWLVPQIEIKLNDNTRISLLDLAHRAADAVVRSSPELQKLVLSAFQALHNGDAGPLTALAPTSLVFGVWDSRGDSGEKRPRLVSSIIRAWDVEPLKRAAQYNSVHKLLDPENWKKISEGAPDKALSGAGLDDAPSTGVPGGVLVKGRIEREVTVNLVALRGLRGSDDAETKAIRKYLLALSLVAATGDIELFLREGALLRIADKKDVWYKVLRRGEPEHVQLPDDLVAYAREAAEPFRKKWLETSEYTFDPIAARALWDNQETQDKQAKKQAQKDKRAQKQGK